MAEPQTMKGATWEWRQPSIRHDLYELVASEEVVASLMLKGVWGEEPAEYRANGHAFTIRRTGLLNPRVIVRESIFNEDIAIMLMGGGKGTIEFPNGRRYTFQRLSIWGNRWAVLDEKGALLASVCKRIRLLRQKGMVVLEDTGRNDDNILLLASLGWYLTSNIVQNTFTFACQAVSLS